MSSRIARAKSVAPDAVGDRRPRLAVVVGAEHVRLEVVLLIAVRRDVRRAGAERRRLDQADAREVPEPFGVTFFQLVPPLRVTCTKPSSDPAQITPASFADGAMLNTVA
jgi:hypothetical protein